MIIVGCAQGDRLNVTVLTKQQNLAWCFSPFSVDGSLVLNLSSQTQVFQPKKAHQSVLRLAFRTRAVVGWGKLAFGVGAGSFARPLVILSVIVWRQDTPMGRISRIFWIVVKLNIHHISCPRFPFPAFLLDKHKRQNDVVQHAHPRRLDFESRLPLLHDLVCAVEFSNYCLLFVCGDQLHTTVQHRWHWKHGEVASPWDSSSPP